MAIKKLISHYLLLVIFIGSCHGHQYKPTYKPPITIAPTKDYGYETKDSFRYPSGCRQGYCEYEAKWNSHSGYIYVTIWARVGKGYFAGIGFSEDRFMPNSDCITGGIPFDGARFLLTDRYLRDRSLADVFIDQQQDAMLQSHSYRNGMLKFQFKRNLYTGDPKDKNLERCHYFIFAWGGRLRKNGLIRPHSKAFASRNKICFGSVPTVQPTITIYTPPAPQPTITIYTPPTPSYPYEAQGLFSYPGRCQTASCTYMAKWHADSIYVYFTIWAKVGEGIWAGIGFSDTGKMPKSDCITGWKAGNSFRLYDRYLLARQADAVPRDKQQDAMLQSHSIWNGMIKFSFKRKINTGDKYDKSLDECRYFLFAWGGKGKDDGSILAHTAKFVSKMKICVAPRPTILPTITLSTVPTTTKPKDYGYETPDSFRYPSYCRLGSCDYEAMWQVRGEYVHFMISAKVGLGYWAGIGFSDDRKMPKSDCVTGWMTSQYAFRLKDRYLFARKPNAVPVDLQQDAKTLSFHHTNGMLKFRFRRKLNTGDKNDKSLDRCRYFLFAWGGKGHNDGTITAHTAQFVSRKLICPVRNPCQHKQCKVNQYCISRDNKAVCRCNAGYYQGQTGHCLRYNSNQNQQYSNPSQLDPYYNQKYPTVQVNDPPYYSHNNYPTGQHHHPYSHYNIHPTYQKHSGHHWK